MSNHRIEKKREKKRLKEEERNVKLKDVKELKEVRYTEMKTVEPQVIETVVQNVIPDIQETVQVETKKAVETFEVDVETKMKKQMEKLNSMRATREENLDLYVNQQLKTLIQRFDDQYARLEENLNAITDFRTKNGVNSNLKSVKKMWEKSLQELKDQKRELEKNLIEQREKIEKERAKELNSIEKEYLTSQLFTKKDLLSQKYRDELNAEIAKIQAAIDSPNKEYEESKMALEVLTKKFTEVKSSIEDKFDDKLYETIKSRKGDKSFTELRVMIPEDKKEELAGLIMKFGYIPESYMKDFERLSEKDVLINESEKEKSKLINEKFEIYREEAEKLEAVILYNKEILDKAEEDKKQAVGEYNEKVKGLNKNLSQISKENEIKKVEKIKTLKTNDIYSENAAVNSKKSVEFEIEKAPKKENIFNRFVNAVKESNIFKSFNAKKEEKAQLKLAKEEEARQKELNSLIASKSGLKSLRENLVSMVNDEPTMNASSSSVKKYKEIDLVSRA